MLDMTLSMESVNSLHPTLLLLLILDVRPGKLEFVPLVQITGLLILMEFVNLFLMLARLTKVFNVQVALLDMLSITEFVNLLLTQDQFLMQDVTIGTGQIKSVTLVLLTGSLMLMEFVPQLIPTVKLMTMQMDTV